MNRVTSVEEAVAILEALRAPPRLVRHGLLVLEAAELLLEEVGRHGARIDEPLVRAGAVLHDCGKIAHPAELAASGSAHEEAGQALLLDHGVDRRIARCCVTHAQWASHDCSLEELVVALADALWKGARWPALEKSFVDQLAVKLAVDPWSLFVPLDDRFEAIAEGGAERLGRSVE